VPARPAPALAAPTLRGEAPPWVGGADTGGRSLGVVRRPSISLGALVGLGLFVVVAWLITRASLVPLLVAAAAVYVLMKIGFTMLGGLSQPVPEPPPPGELRKVRIMYRCSVCGTEVRMTVANDEMPEPPRHCLEDMDLVTPVDDL